MTTPLPCPFCGKPPVVLPLDPANEGNAFGRVECANSDCPSEMGPSVWDGVGIADDRGSDAYKEAAIIRWNSRFNQDKILMIHSLALQSQVEEFVSKTDGARVLLAEIKAHLWSMIAQGQNSTEELRLHQKIIDWEQS